MTGATVGRVRLRKVSGWSQTPAGGQLTSRVEGTRVEVAGQVQRLKGMAGATVPVVWPADPSVEGWWKVAGVSAATVLATERAFVDVTVDLERVGRQVGWTSILTPAADGTAWHAAPSGARQVDRQASSTVQRDSVDGPVTVALGVTGDPIWTVDPDGWWAGGVRLDVDGQPVAGTEDVASLRWQASNGIVSVGQSDGGLELSWWDGTSWQSMVWTVRRNGTAPEWGSPRVLRNGPAQVVVRLHDPATAATLDVQVTRGARWAALWVDAPGATITVSCGLSGSLVTGGIANGWVVGSSGAPTRTAGTGTLTFAGGQADAMIGHAGGENAAGLIAQHVGTPAVRDVAVIR